MHLDTFVFILSDSGLDKEIIELCHQYYTLMILRVKVCRKKRIVQSSFVGQNAWDMFQFKCKPCKSNMIPLIRPFHLRRDIFCWVIVHNDTEKIMKDVLTYAIDAEQHGFAITAPYFNNTMTIVVWDYETYNVDLTQCLIKKVVAQISINIQGSVYTVRIDNIQEYKMYRPAILFALKLLFLEKEIRRLEIQLLHK